MVAIPAGGGRVAHMLTVKLKSFDGVDQTERESEAEEGRDR